MTDPSTLNSAEKACVAALEAAFPADSVVPPEDADYLRTHNTYVRYARATEGKVEKAKKRLQETIDFRKEWKVGQLTFENVAKVYATIGPIRLGGRCKEGRPVFLLTMGEENDDFPLEERLQCMMYILESLQRKGYERITWIVDFGDKEKSKKDDKKKDEMRKKAMEILDKHYPERLGKMLFYRAAWYMTLLLPVVKRTLPSNTRPKIINVGGNLKDLEKYIEVTQIPEHIGGTFQDWILTDMEDKLPPCNV